jgi:hypothetical protein
MEPIVCLHISPEEADRAIAIREIAGRSGELLVLPDDAEIEFVAPRLRLMRGQVVVREEIPPPSPALWTPEQGPRQVKTHRGVVLGLGPPARLTEHPASPEVPHGFVVGDVVQYHFAAVGTQASRTRGWVDGKPATWLHQGEIDGVWES